MINLKNSNSDSLTGRVGESPTLRLAEFSFEHSKAGSPTRRVGESFFDNKYVREIEARIVTTGKVV